MICGETCPINKARSPRQSKPLVNLNLGSLVRLCEIQPAPSGRCGVKVRMETKKKRKSPWVNDPDKIVAAEPGAEAVQGAAPQPRTAFSGLFPRASQFDFLCIGRTSIWSLRKRIESGRVVRLATIEVSNKQRRIVQVRRRWNRLPTGGDLSILVRWGDEGGPELSSWLAR